MIISLNWKICFGACIAFILVVWLYNVFISFNFANRLSFGEKLSDLNDEEQIADKMKNYREEAKRDFLEKDIYYYENERKRKREKERLRRERKIEEEAWKRKYLYQHNEPKRKKSSEPLEINLLNDEFSSSPSSGNKKKIEKITPWGRPDKSTGEKLCAQILSNLLNLEFSTYRLDEIINPKTGKPLEIDCYNPETKIGLEYNGPQHTEYPNWLNEPKTTFLERAIRDQFKYDKCHQLGIRLIVVPYTIKYEELRDFILDQLQTLGVELNFSGGLREKENEEEEMNEVNEVENEEVSEPNE